MSIKNNIQKAIIAFIAVIMTLTVCENFLLLRNPFNYCFIILIIFLLSAMIYKLKIPPRITIISILILSFMLRLIFILLVQTKIKSDFAIMYNASKEVTNGNLSIFNKLYFQNWAYQTPFVLYQALILKLSGSVFVLKLLNICFMTGTNLMIYLIVRKMVSERSAAVVALLYAVYPAPILLSSVLTNQHISTFLIYLGIYILMRKSNVKNLIIAGTCFGVGNLMRPDGIIVISAIVIASVILIKKVSAAKNKISILKKTGIVVATYLLIFCSVNLIVKVSAININGISNKFPEWKIVEGLDNKTFGQYNRKDCYLLKIKDPNIRKEESIRIIRTSFENGNGIADFLIRKTAIMWAANESSFHSVFEKDVSLIKWMTGFDKSLYIFMLIAFIFSCVMILINKTKFNEKSFFFITMISINYCVYLLIEIKTRYRYFIMPSIFIASAIFFANFDRLEIRNTIKRIKRRMRFRNMEDEENDGFENKNE